MNRLTRCLLASAALVLIGPAAAPGMIAADAITAAGVGELKLGMTYNAAHKAGLVAGLRRGCELAGTGARSARLTAPLRGSVNLSMDSPRTVETILLTGGARARGVGAGSTARAVKKAFPKVKVSHATDKTFGISQYRVPKSGGGPLEFGVSTTTHRVTVVGLPALSFCD
jgi:hypothetical protein